MSDLTQPLPFDVNAAAESSAYGAGYWIGSQIAEAIEAAGDYKDDYFVILMDAVVRGAITGLEEESVSLEYTPLVTTMEAQAWRHEQRYREGYEAAKAELMGSRKRKPIAGKVRLAVFERDAYRCVICQSWEDLTIDHIHPVIAGGDNDINNLQTMCRRCNSAKGARVGGN
jgi:5-methylcytosine-specific restriction endonuclease McrA